MAPRLCLTSLCLAAGFAGGACADQTPADDKDPVPYHSAGNAPGAAASSNFLIEGPMGGIWQRGALLGDMGGLRSYLGQYGISLSLQETSELLGNTTGGVKQSAAYDGLTTLDFTLNTQRAFGWLGGTFNVSALQIHGANLSQSNLLTLQTASGIEADNGVRLWELWYDQLFDHNEMDVKIGQQSIDQEFMVSQYSGLFVNTMSGWPMLPSADMLAGGPAYPLSSPGVRLRYQPPGPITLLAGVFDDHPGGECDGGDPQVCDRRGVRFRVNDDALLLAEIQYAHPAMGEFEYAGKAPPLPGIYRLGFWADSGRFADQRYDMSGLSLADPLSAGDPKLHRRDGSVYTVIDQLLWRESAQSEESVGFFFRGMVAPDDRNLINMSLNTGLTFREPFEHREDDIVGIAYSYASLSNAASALDRDTAFYTNSNYPVRGGEHVVELTYQYALAPWLVLQPDAQYVFHPGGGILNPNDPSGLSRVGDEAVFGLRTNITF